jgi:hypothetical protein
VQPYVPPYLCPSSGRGTKVVYTLHISQAMEANNRIDSTRASLQTLPPKIQCKIFALLDYPSALFLTATCNSICSARTTPLMFQEWGARVAFIDVAQEFPPELVLDSSRNWSTSSNWQFCRQYSGRLLIGSADPRKLHRSRPAASRRVQMIHVIATLWLHDLLKLRRRALRYSLPSIYSSPKANTQLH